MNQNSLPAMRKNIVIQPKRGDLMASLKYLFVESINSAFTPGSSKHADRYNVEVDSSTKIYSYSSRKNMIDTACNFANFCKEKQVCTGSTSHKLKSLNTGLVQDFLKEKQSQGCNYTTLKRYQSELSKLGKLVSNRYNRNVNLTVKDIKQKKVSNDEKIRTVAVSDKDFKAFCDSKRESKSLMAVKFCRAFGLRVSEVIKLTPADLKKDNIFIRQSKGGRDRTIEIRTAEQKELVKELKSNYCEGLKRSERIINLKADSINKYLHKGFLKIGIKTYSECKTGVHALRKAYATEYYNELRNLGFNHKNAWNMVSEELGHGHDREDLFRVYVVK